MLDEHFMNCAIEIARSGEGQTSPNPLVGAVIVQDGLIVGQGAHLRAGTPHAEVHALRMAGDKAQGATMYVTLEPCNHHGRTPPCSEAIIEAGIRRVVVASVDHDPRTRHLGIARLKQAGLDVTVGVLQEEAEGLNRAFFHRVDTGRPLVVYKTAATMSGHTAAGNGQSQYVTGSEARQDVQRLRRIHSGIMVGIGTVLADDPRLTVRTEDGSLSDALQPMRVVFDSKLRMPESAALLREPGETLIVTTDQTLQAKRAQAEALQVKSNVHVLGAKEATNGQVSLAEALRTVADRGINSILLEGGPTLAGAMLAEELIDEVMIYFAPKLLTSGLPMLQGTATTHMNESVNLYDVEMTPIGQDIRFHAKVRYENKADVQEGDAHVYRTR